MPLLAWIFGGRSASAVLVRWALQLGLAVALKEAEEAARESAVLKDPLAFSVLGALVRIARSSISFFQKRTCSLACDASCFLCGTWEPNLL